MTRTKDNGVEVPRGRIAKHSHAGPLALSVRQPWASLIVHFGKLIENRSWDTDYRGDLFIHASGQMNHGEYFNVREWVMTHKLVSPEAFPALEDLPMGMIIGRTRIVDTRSSPVSYELSSSGECLKPWEFSDGYAWELAKPVWTQHIRVNGTHKLWIIPDPVLAQLRVRPLEVAR